MQVLQGRKFAFQYWQINACRVLHRSEFTIKRVLKAFENHAQLRRYMPDEPEKHTTREHLFQIVSTLDPTFFDRAVLDLDAELREKELKKAKEVVEIDPRMLEMMRRLADFSTEAGNGRSLQNTKVGSKKRTRMTYEKSMELNTRINIRRDKEMAQFVVEPGPLRKFTI